MHALLTPKVLRLVFLPAYFQIELASRACRRATEDPGVGGKREWNPCQLIDPHSAGNGNRRHLSDVDRPLADDVAAEDFVGRALDDQLAEAGRPPVDDRARSRVKADNRCYDIVFFTRLPIGATSFGNVIAASRTAFVPATKPSCIACGSSIRRPVTSPAAKTCAADVRR